jgi:hypothetical protein
MGRTLAKEDLWTISPDARLLLRPDPPETAGRRRAMRFSRILYVVLVYLNVAAFVFPDELARLLPSSLNWWSLQVVWWLVLLAVGVLVIAEGVRAGFRNDAGHLLRSMAWFKMSLVPFFVLNFMLFAVIFLGLGIVGGFFTFMDLAYEREAVLSGGWALGLFSALSVWAFGVVVAVLTYAIFLPSSADGIAFLIVMRRRHQISIPAFLLHLVLHLLFVADLVSTVILLVTYWKTVVSGGDAKVESDADRAAAGAVEATA